MPSYRKRNLNICEEDRFTPPTMNVLAKVHAHLHWLDTMREKHERAQEVGAMFELLAANPEALFELGAKEPNFIDMIRAQCDNLLPQLERPEIPVDVRDETARVLRVVASIIDGRMEVLTTK